MRYYYYLFFSTFYFVVSPLVNTWGQESTVIIDEAFQNIPLAEVLDILQEKYQLKVAFDQETIEGIIIHQDISNLSLTQALESLLKGQRIDYQVVGGNQVFLRQSFDAPLRLTNCTGRILDALTGAPLAFATIVYSPGKGTSTDANGAFSFETTEPVDHFAVQYLGYESVEVPLPKQPTNNLTIRLTPKPMDIPSITVIENEPLISSNNDIYGGIKLNAQQISSIPSFVGGRDVLRSLQFLPGVSAHDDLSAEVKVRGSNGDENMVILDGIQLYNVGHFFGIFSIINPGIVDEVKLYKNVYPIEFGGRTASVLDITSLPLENNKVSGSAEINLLTSNAHIELPLGSKMSLLLGGRITNKNVADTRLFAPLDQNTRRPREEVASQNELLFALDPNFSFYDANAKWKWQASKNTDITLSFFSGQDKFNYNLNRQITNGFQTREDGIFSEEADWKNRGASFNLVQQWSPTFQSQLTLSRSNYSNFSKTNAFVVRDLGEAAGRERIDISNTRQNEIFGSDVLIKNTWSPNQQETFIFGAQLNNSRAQNSIQTDSTAILETDKTASQFSLFAEYQTKIKQKLGITIGIRPTFYNVTKQVYLSPRVYLTFPANKPSYFKASWSQYQQFLRQSYHENRLGRVFEFWVIADDHRFPVSKAQQFMLGWNTKKDGFELDIELYHKKIDGVIEHALIFNGVEEIDGMISPTFAYHIFNGEGRSYGIDILLKKEIGKYAGWLAYTLSKTEQSFPQIANGIYFASPVDRRHQLKWIHQYRHKRWDFSLAYVFTSGAPYTDLSRLASGQRDRRLIDPNDRISYLENYHRVDVGVNYRFPIFGTNGELGFSIFNLLDQRNVKYRQYNYASAVLPNHNFKLIGTEIQMLGITPNLSFKVNFGQ